MSYYPFILYDNELEMRKVEFKRSVPAFVWRESGEPFKKIRLSPLDWDSSLDLPFISGPVQHGNDALDHAATETYSAPVIVRTSSEALFLVEPILGVMACTAWPPFRIYGNSMWSSLKEHQL
uniref:Uncharacterized protein n=1 Tax=Timema poppense TaxID=170557 RepID=A0A7R9H387_TIMPO|nr:unnamed protein product [Timema poppensis]